MPRLSLAASPAPRLVRGAVAAIAAAAALALAGCGGQDEPPAAARAPEPVVLSLDFVPNAVHAPIYEASRRGRDRAAGVKLDIRKPAGGPDALKLVAAGKVDIGVLDIHDLAIVREQGTDLVAVGALVGRPLAALIGQPQVKRPRDLEGKTLGVSGLPSDPAFSRAIVEADGGDLDSVRQVTIGFNAVSRLLSRRVDAVPAFWNAEGIALRQRGVAISEFRVEDYGAPPYPEVVLITSRRTLERRRAALVATLDALEAGRRDTLADPRQAARTIAQAADSRDVALVRAQLRAVAPLFAEDLRLDRSVLEDWARFDARIGIVREVPDVGRAFDFSLR